MPGGSGAGAAGPGTLRRCPGGQRTQRGRPAGRWGCARLLLRCPGAFTGRGLLSPGSAAASVPGARGAGQDEAGRLRGLSEGSGRPGQEEGRR